MSRQLLGIAGIVLAVMGLAYDSAPVIWAAIGVLGVALAWRVAARVRERRARNSPE